MSERLGASFAIDITQLQAGLKTANKLIRESQSEFKAAAAGMDDWTKSEAGLTARNASLNSIIQVQQTKVDALKASYQQMINDGLDPTSDRAIQLRTQINNEQAALEKNQAEVDRNTQALAELGNESTDTSDKVQKAGDGFTVFKGVLANLATDAIRACVDGFKKLGSAAVEVGKQALSSYADYEQLKGGVETLFKDSADEVMKYSQEAYKTAGLSANEYMEQATSTSASLIQSLGGDTKKAAEYANMAIVDMSDNANKMGTDIQSIQNAYGGFAKQNYTMLDNLKLGYGGTKEEMQRLLDDASKISGIKYDVSSYSDIVDAIHIVQGEMGITGTTAKEASETISGSISTMKGAWTNLLTGMADENADFDQLITNFIDSVGTVAQNLIPRISVVIKGILKLIQGILPQIPPMLKEFLPTLVQGVMELVQGVVELLPTIIDSIMEILPMLINSLIGMIPTIITAILQIVASLIQTIGTALPTILNAIMKLLPQLVNSLVNSIPQLLNAAVQLLMAIVQAIPKILPKLVETLPKIITSIVNVLIQNLPTIINAAIQLFTAIITAIPKIIPPLVKALPTIIKAIFNALTSPDAISSIAKAGEDLIKGLWNGISNMASWIHEKIKGFGKGVLNNLKSFFGIHSPSKVMENVIGKNLALGIGKGFEKNIGKVNSKIKSSISPLVDVNAQSGFDTGERKNVVINQTNNYSQAHSRYEMYKSRQQTAAAVRLALGAK